MPFRFNPFTSKLDLTDTGGSGGGSVDSLTGNSGGAVGPDISGNINVIGGGSISVTGNSLTNTLTISSSNPFFSWTVITSNQMAVTQTGYFVDGGARVEVQLPTTSTVGDIFCVIDKGGNGWRITQDSGQQIKVLTSASTVGGSGYVESIFVGDGITLVCSVDNQEWIAYPPQGNLTIV